MGSEHGEWIIRGADENDGFFLSDADDLEALINQWGFLPLFANKVPGFSVEEHTDGSFWWTGDELRDPWEWRHQLTDRRTVAYGKFFNKKAGFISLKWLPCFANYRREGYDFDARWEDEKASYRQKKIMDCFAEDSDLFSFELKQLAQFGQGGERNFEGIMTELQMQTYLVVSDFLQRCNKAGKPYGWRIARYTKPETVWSCQLVQAAYGEKPEDSFTRILERAKELFPTADEKELQKLLK